MLQLKLIIWILIGFLLVKTCSKVSEALATKVRTLAFRFLMPCLFFNALYQADLSQLPEPGLFVAYYGVLVGLFVLLVWQQGKYQLTKVTSGVNALSALYPNAVGIGVPLVFALFGEQAQVTLMALIALNLMFVLPGFNIWLSLTTTISEPIFSKIAKDPVLLAIMAGLIFNLANIRLPNEVTHTLDLLSQLALPMILIALGASLGFYPLRLSIVRRVAHLLAVKLVVFPALLLLVILVFFQLDPVTVKVAIIVASLPTGINAYLYADKFQASLENTASVIMLSTACSLLTINIWILLLNQVFVTA